MGRRSYRKTIVISLLLVFFNSANITKTDYSEAFAAGLSSNSPNSVTISTPFPSPGANEGGRKVRLPIFVGVIRRNAAAYGLDWRLVLAVMKQESQFDVNAISPRGARGLMQVMPSTGVEVASRLGYDNLLHPHRNIKGGTYYLANLLRLFESAPDGDKLKLAIASYNAGPSRIYDAQDIAAYLGENPNSWQSVEKALPLLSKRYYTLHRSVWDGGIPRSGYFGKSRQTILYVHKVVENYEEYKLLLN